MEKLKAINIMDNKGFWPEKASLIDAIRDVLSIGHCTTELPVRDFGRFRSPHWRDDDNTLVPWQSVDWYIYDSLDEDRMQVNAPALLNNLANEPWRDARLLGDHYDLFILEEDLYLPEEEGKGPGYCVGASKPFSSAVISLHRIEHIWGLPYSCIKTEIMRQMCFMLGVPSHLREDVHKGTDASAFCKNVCILRRAENAPEDWEKLTDDRLREGALCDSCRDDLQRFFSDISHKHN